ncbi:MAG: hypothetical protein J3K34DRAFT_63379 [Monoraphidium minutum]|nr:MAG: hypothetical protein J3K34DRAFT_63379 [Monoraphidium minutum]
MQANAGRYGGAGQGARGVAPSVWGARRGLTRGGAGPGRAAAARNRWGPKGGVRRRAGWGGPRQERYGVGGGVGWSGRGWLLVTSAPTASTGKEDDLGEEGVRLAAAANAAAVPRREIPKPRGLRRRPARRRTRPRGRIAAAAAVRLGQARFRAGRPRGAPPWWGEARPGVRGPALGGGGEGRRRASAVGRGVSPCQKWSTPARARPRLAAAAPAQQARPGGRPRTRAPPLGAAAARGGSPMG